MPKHKSKPPPRQRSSPINLPPKPPAAVLRSVLHLRDHIENNRNWLSLRDGHAKLHDLLTALRKQQASTRYYKAVIPSRDQSAFDAFKRWLNTNGVTAADAAPLPFDVAFRDPAGHDATLFANRPLEKGETFVRIPREAMLSADVHRSPLKELVEMIPALCEMPSLLLALRVLAEAADDTSRFREYIRILPSAFSTPFFGFTAAEVEMMWPSPAGLSTIRALRAQMRDYTYVYEAVHKLRLRQLGVAVLSLDNFIWALSVVMTRQNALRGKGGLVLVPGWDMCNHQRGEQRTGVVEREGDIWVECDAMEEVQVGGEIRICYGERGNGQLLLYSGFVEEGNQFDSLPVVLRMGRGELEGFKAKVMLPRWGVEVRERWDGWEIGGVLEWGEECVRRLKGIARVIVADKEGIGKMLKMGKGLPTECVEGVAEEDANKVVRGTLLGLLGEYESGEEVDEREVTEAVKLVRSLHREEVKLVNRLLRAFE